LLNSGPVSEGSFELSDQYMESAFLIYSKYWKKINPDYSIFVSTEKKDKGKSLFL
jgi:hypothetical protein